MPGLSAVSGEFIHTMLLIPAKGEKRSFMLKYGVEKWQQIFKTMISHIEVLWSCICCVGGLSLQRSL